MDHTAAHYTVLARRFRPQTFAEVIGQQHVAQALQNAIRSGRVAHAYLFTGARGVGKTSMARILAKALNCPNASDGVPCNACEICDSISSGNDVDVLEIDGASNRGIDDVRTLRANVNVKSMRSRYKVYIIDEVHMLTREAFNALLKTLEEPPPNVKFVFCTTEPNKVPDTILSRCQRFDFAHIDTQNIIARLQQIAQDEGYDVEPQALELVARRATGSMRDSQSLFDQLLAFGEDRITAQDVHRMLGTADEQRLMGIAGALLQRDRQTALQEFAAALTEGAQLGEIVEQFIHYFRDLMIIAAGAQTVPLLSVSESSREELTRQAEQWGLETVTAALQILVETKGKMFRTAFGRPLAEMALVRISLLEDLDNIAAVIRDLTSGDGSQQSSGRVSGSRPGSTTGRPASTTGRSSPASRGGGTSQVANPRPSASQRNAQQASSSGSVAAPAAGTGDSVSAGTQPGGLGTRPGGLGTQPDGVEAQAGGLGALQSGSEKTLLSQLVDNTDDAIRTHLRMASLAISGPKQVDLLFPAGYHFPKQYCERPEVRSRIEQALSGLVGEPVQVRMRIDESPPAASVGQPREPARHRTEQPERLKDAENDPFVRDAMEVFGGSVKDIRPLPAGPSDRE